MSDLATTRSELTRLLEVVLPGRVQPHPPTSGRYVTPSVFLEQATIGGTMTEPVATFPVWVVADGAVEAQIAAHDGIVWNAVLALHPYATSIVARPAPVAGLRATVIEVDVLLDAFGLCGASPARRYRATLAG